MLTLDYKKIANWESVCYMDDPESGKRVERPFNLAMGIALMQVGLNGITAANAERFYERVKLAEACIGAFFTNGDGTPGYIMADDVHRYIGLASNVTARSDAWFYKRLREELVPTLHQSYRLAATQRDEAAEAALRG